ncbi:hypothetical protein C8Q79DRAFT_940804 [Trametes meyenii]|nr:hypothetical protein C8Q79DRAFT_940804 [Trametes meyenii]
MGSNLSLTAQHPHISESVRASFARLETRLAFDDAFPNAVGRTHYVNRAMSDSARDFGYTGLQERLDNDIRFARTLSVLPSQRISTFRGLVKKCTDTHVVAFFGLAQSPQCEEKVIWLLNHLTYIYPAEFGHGNVPWNKPYQNPSIVAVLRACFFTGASSFGIRNLGRFSSTLNTRPDEKEILMPMLALIGASIHASLSEWRSGIHKPTPFSSDSYADAYNEHVLLLKGILAKNGKAYHVMMHRLYQQSTGAHADHPALLAANHALAQVNIDDMDME